MLEQQIREAVEEILPIHYRDGKPIMRPPMSDREAVDRAMEKIMRLILYPSTPASAVFPHEHSISQRPDEPWLGAA